MAFPSNPTGILYQSADHTITLLDIPLSIAVAQARPGTLLSSAPLEAPLDIKDGFRPKSQTAQAHQAQESADGLQHAQYKQLILAALAEIKASVPGSWCAPRTLLPQVPPTRDAMEIDGDAERDLEARFREWAAWAQSKGDDVASDVQRLMASLGAPSEHDAAPTKSASPEWTVSYTPAREPMQTEKDALPEPWTSTFHNPASHSLDLIISEHNPREAHPRKEYGFTIPARSTLFLCDSTHSDAFRASFRQVTAEYVLPRHFDLVLLDPPWPNRSAKRKGAYEQVGGMPYLKKMLLSMDIDTYLEHSALVGVWLTNKASLRNHVLGSGGLFEAWNVGLVEEWIWVKTTTKGEPMFDLDAAMRKPYEVLLLGRAAPNSWTTMAHAANVKRRVIAAVPDVHSRKPCLKELLEPYMPDPREYSALEVFSRYLVKGWTSWGNEVLKYNSDHYWSKESTQEAARHYSLPMRFA